MRRFGSFLVVLLALTVSAAASIRSVAGAVAGIASAVRELSTREQAVHALNRLGFGARPGEVDRVMRLGVDQWIDQQLRPERINDRELDRVLAAFPAVFRSADELLRDYPPPGAQLVRARLRGDSMLTRQDSVALRREAQRNREFVAELISSKVARAVVSERQLQEVMTDFWQNHFSVFIGKGQLRYYLADYDRETIRPNALGSFRELLEAVAKSPAMLFYLDNAQSVADSGQPTLAANGGGRGLRGRGAFGRPGRSNRPGVQRRLPPGIQDRIARGDTAGMREQMTDLAQQIQQRRPRGLNENYARELLELHTLGVDGGYTQKDVVEVARALTGWSMGPPRQGGGFVFRAEAHDAGDKIVLGHRLRAGRGIQDGEDVLDIVSRHPSTARYVARKLCVRFVNDAPVDALVERAAATFTRTNGDIREVVRTIVTSPEFFSRAAYRAKVKSPFEVTVSALRALGARADTTAVSAAQVARLGQPIYGHQAPNGWPETGAAWMNTGAILNRINFGLMVATGRLPGASLRDWPSYETLVNAPRPAQVDGVIAGLLSGHASPDTRQILLSGTNPLLAKTSSDSSMSVADDAVSPPDMTGDTPRRDRPRPLQRVGGFGQVPQLSGLAQVIGLALGSPEFQRR